MRKLCLFTTGFVLACLAVVLVRVGSPGWAVAGGGALMAAWLFRRRKKTARRAAILLLGLSVGFVWCNLYQALFLRPLSEVDGSVVSVQARVLEAPHQTRYGGSVLVRIDLDGRNVRGVLYYSQQPETPEPGDWIGCEAKLVRGEEKDDSYYFGKGILLVGTVKGDWTVQRETGTIWSWPARFAVRLGETVARCFPEDVAGFLHGLLLGTRDGMDYAEKNALSIAGIYHAVAVSGMHVSILFGMIGLLCGARRGLAAVIGLPVVALFVMMSGMAASSIRAGIMLALLLLAPLVRREDDPMTSIAVALLVLLAVNPWVILDVGLQLSFASTAGILLFSGKLYRAFSGPVRMEKFLARHGVIGWLVRGMRSALCCSLASMVFSLPLTAVHFEMVSLVALVVNPLCLWAVSILFTGGLLIALLGLALPGVATGLGWVLAWLARYVLLVVHLAAKLPFAAVYLNSPYWVLFAVALYGVTALLTFRPEAVRKWEAAAALSGCFAVCMGCAWVEYRTADFSFTALDVGQGQCLIFQTERAVTVIDCGGVGDETGELAARELQSRGVRTIDALVLTHFDADHVNGAVQLMQRVKVETLYLPDVEGGNGWRATLCEVAEEAGSLVEFVREDSQISPSVTLFAPVSDKNDNDAGICCLASVGEYDILITGDLSEQAEQRLLSLHDLPDIELLVVGHHGARTSTGEAILALTRPELALISVGAENWYGHPAQQTLDRLDAYGVEVLRTDLQGTITIWR